MPRAAKSNYCEYHRRRLLPLQSSREVTASLYEPIGQGFVPVTGLTQSLARLYACVAEGTVNVKAKDAIAMTRVAETLLKTVPLSDAEFKHIYLKDYRQPPESHSSRRIHPPPNACRIRSQTRPVAAGLPAVHFRELSSLKYVLTASPPNNPCGLNGYPALSKHATYKPIRMNTYNAINH